MVPIIHFDTAIKRFGWTLNGAQSSVQRYEVAGQKRVKCTKKQSTLPGKMSMRSMQEKVFTVHPRPFLHWYKHLCKKWREMEKIERIQGYCGLVALYNMVLK